MRSAPSGRDTIFRITSMTKPVTAAAAMILVDEGKLRLDDPVDGFLPELALVTGVYADSTLPSTTRSPLERAITLRDLLTFRMAWVRHRLGPARMRRPSNALANELTELGAFGPPEPTGVPPPPDEWMRPLRHAVPLMHQPGERWMYNTGSEVLGVLVARVCCECPSIAIFFRQTALRAARHEGHGLQRPGVEAPSPRDRVLRGQPSG